MTLAFEDANSKRLDDVTVADVDAEDHIGKSLLIWELIFGQVMSPHHSDQMSQWSQVSRIVLCMAKVKVS